MQDEEDKEDEKPTLKNDYTMFYRFWSYFYLMIVFHREYARLLYGDSDSEEEVEEADEDDVDDVQRDKVEEEDDVQRNNLFRSFSNIWL
ncbi:hypothetical protein Q3G72_010345 [Acer saccharum]|nr:hypothetical protein Q3G72_010345 [Acer saccharum]